MSTVQVSVALCTRNGARFLRELLDSLNAQTLTPAEVVVCDDASNDQTRNILEEFAQHAAFPVRVYANQAPLGVARNFESAIGLCSGQIIALADQDDVWRVDKLEKLAVTLALAIPNTLAAFSDAEVVDATLAPLGYTLWQRVRFSPREQDRVALADGFEVLLKHQVVTGATLAFTASLRDSALPIPVGWAHDAWLALIAAAQGRLTAVPEVLIAYRQHDDNVVGGIRKSLVSQIRKSFKLDRAAWYHEELKLWRSLGERLDALSIPQAVRSALAEKITHLERRANLPTVRWRRLPTVLVEFFTGRYARYARNWGSMALDLLVK